MSVSEVEPAFSESSAQDTALASREAQEWIEVLERSRPNNVVLFVVTMAELSIISCMFLYIGCNWKDFFGFFPRVLGGWSAVMRVSKLTVACSLG